MPPWARADEAPSPIGAAVTTVTGRGASFSAQNKPAKPAADDDDVVEPVPGFGGEEFLLGGVGHSLLSVIPEAAKRLSGIQDLLRLCSWIPALAADAARPG